MNERFYDALNKYGLSASDILTADLIPELKEMSRKRIVYNESLKCFKYKTFYIDPLFENDCDDRRQYNEWSNNEFYIDFNYRQTHPGRRAKAEMDELKYRLACAIKFNIVLLDKLYRKFKADFYTQMDIDGEMNSIGFKFWNDRNIDFDLNDIENYGVDPCIIISIHKD